MGRNAIYMLETSARSMLADPELIPGFEKLHFARPAVRLWHYPSLRGPWNSLVLYRTDVRRFQPLNMAPICEITWDRPADVQAASRRNLTIADRVEPTIMFRRALVSLEIIKLRIETLQALAFQPFSESAVGTDGTPRGVEAKFGQGNSSISWWGTAPKGLTPLAEWFDETLAVLQGEVAATAVKK